MGERRIAELLTAPRSSKVDHFPSRRIGKLPSNQRLGDEMQPTALKPYALFLTDVAWYGALNWKAAF